MLNQNAATWNARYGSSMGSQPCESGNQFIFSQINILNLRVNSMIERVDVLAEKVEKILDSLNAKKGEG